MSNDRFLSRLIYLSLVLVFLLVVGVLFGPFDIDPQTSVLLSFIAQPGSVALGALIQRRHQERAGEPS